MSLVENLFPFFERLFKGISPPSWCITFFLLSMIQMKDNLDQLQCGGAEFRFMYNLQLGSDLWSRFVSRGSLSLLLATRLVFSKRKLITRKDQYLKSILLQRMTAGLKKRMIYALRSDGIFLHSRGRYREALPIYRDLAILGYSPAFAILAIDWFINPNQVFKKDIVYAMQLVSVGSQHSNCNRCDGVLAYCLIKTKEDLQKAFHLALKSSESGDVIGFLALALYFLEEEKDYVRARLLFLQAAKKNEPKSLYNLAKIYERGLGVAQDFNEAYRYYKLAAEKNHPKAIRIVRRKERDEYYRSGGCSD